MLPKMQKVKVNACVYTSYNTLESLGYTEQTTIIYEPKGKSKKDKKSLFRYEFDNNHKFTGFVIGQTRRATGHYYNGNGGPGYDREEPSLGIDKWHTVYLVEDLHSDKWHEPFLCLESDLEVINE